MNPQDQAARTLAAAESVRDVVLGAEGRVIPTRAPRTPPRAAYRGGLRRRQAWLKKAEQSLDNPHPGGRSFE
jgi:hypothetical protein